MKKVYLFLAIMFIALNLFAQDYSKLHLIGDATTAGWTNSAAVPMDLVVGSDAVFTWTGELKNGPFKFLNARGSWDNSFNAPSTDLSVVLGQTYALLFSASNAIDNKFIISTSDLYTVTVDMRNLTMVVTKAVITLPTEFWAIGTAVPNGKVKLKLDTEGNVTKLKYIGQLTAGGTLKFSSTETEGSETQYLVPVTGNAEIVGATTSKLIKDITATGWSVATSATTYKIELNVLNNSVNAEIFQPWSAVYIVGGATAADWEPANAIPLLADSEDPNLFVFDGNLQIGTHNDQNKFKFIGQNTGWGPKSLLASSVDKPIIGSTNLLVSSTDNKWIINSNQQGRYIIKVNLLLETIEARYIDTTTSTNPIAEANYFTLIPLKGSVDIKLSSNNVAHAELMDLSGRKIASAQNSMRISLGNKVPAGVYIVKINYNNKQFVEKVVIK